MLLIESQFCPPTSVILQMVTHGDVMIEAHEHYQKRSYRNRIHLAGPQGVSTFSIPLRKGKNAQTSIQDVLISYDDDWIRQLAGLLQTNYGSAPFYEYYIEDLLGIFKREYTLIFELNMALLQYFIQTLDLSISVSTSVEYDANPSTALDLRGSSSLRDPDKSAPYYRQVYEYAHGFLPDLSIIDMLFCCGPESKMVLAESRK